LLSDPGGLILRAFHLVFFGLFLPFAAIRGRGVLIGRSLPPRKRHLRAVIIQLILLASLSLVVARFSGIELFPRRAPPMRAIGAGASVLAVAIIVMRPFWRKAVLERKRIVYFFMPSDGTERLLWIAAAGLAGFGEEVTWRGVQTALLARLTGSVAMAIALSVVMFSVSHVEQGWKSVLVVVPFASTFHLLVWLSGSLYVAMAVHFLYDAIAGLSYGRLGRELGYSPDAFQVRETAAEPLPASAADPF
jgi:membrane protease YdiL (CAAX protease family)